MGVFFFILYRTLTGWLRNFVNEGFSRPANLSRTVTVSVPFWYGIISLVVMIELSIVNRKALCCLQKKEKLVFALLYCC